MSLRAVILHVASGLLVLRLALAEPNPAPNREEP